MPNQILNLVDGVPQIITAKPLDAQEENQELCFHPFLE